MGIVDWVFPKLCVGCGKEGEYACRECWERVEKVGAICPMCEKPSVGGWVHERCGRKWGMERLIVTYRYKGLVQKLMKQVKYRSGWEIVDEVGNRWIKRVVDGGSGLVTSVPMYLRKQRRTGFNQAERLARRWVDGKGGGEYVELVERVKQTAPQYGMSKKERARNMDGAFVLRGGAGEKVRGKRVIVVDDVWTTGSTLKEIAKVLKRAGASEVWGVVVAR